MYSDSNRKIFFSQVWVQGIVVLVSEDGDDLFLDDGTGIIEANGITKIVKDLFIQKGDYRFSLTFDLSEAVLSMRFEVGGFLRTAPARVI